MASSIAGEMMALITSCPYKQIIPSLPAGAGLSESIFPRTILAKHYILETERWLDGSFRNPNALFELFGEFSNNTALQVRKSMLKFLGITKKRGAKESKILKNVWIALHMQGLTARQWVDAMFNKDTTGKEIAIFALCKLYKLNCLVFTSQKPWCTMEPVSPLTEAELFKQCKIHLLYIEPGVFGELHPRPAMPPAPLPIGIFESATANVP